MRERVDVYILFWCQCIRLFELTTKRAFMCYHHARCGFVLARNLKGVYARRKALRKCGSLKEST